MKNLLLKFSIFILVVTLILISYFTQPSAEMNKSYNLSINSIIDTQFQIGAIQDGYNNMYNHISDSLRFNLWHQYTSLNIGWDNNTEDNIINPPSMYGGDVQDRLAENEYYNLRTYFDRPTVSYIISGQRTDYECEDVAENSNIYWFNSYANSVINNNVSDITDNTTFGGGAVVKQCLTYSENPSSIAGYINTGIRANRNLSYGVAANPWCSDDYWDWFVMPRIRIDPSYAAGTVNDEEVVCRIEISGWDESKFYKTVELKVKNFKDHNNSYNGNYIDQFNFSVSQENLILTKRTIHDYFISDDVFNWDSNINCDVDIKIYWTGKCDMWIDRVRLENEPAHNYLTLKEDWWLNKINAEIDWANNNNKGVPNYFYFEENTLSHFPLIQALNKQIMDNSYPKNSNSLMIWYNDYQVNAQIPPLSSGASGHFTNEQVKELLIDSCKLNTIMIGWYGLEGWNTNQFADRISYHPSSLTSAGYSEPDCRLSYPTNASAYEIWLQNRYDTDLSAKNNLINVDKLMDYLSRQGLNVINCPQAHSYYAAQGPLKEPTNEEIELQTCLALTYNTKGIMFYAFCSYQNDLIHEWGRGIINTDCTERRVTAYGQDKYKQIKSISNKLNKWGSYFMKFLPNQTKSCIYRFQNERNNFFPNSYINDVRTSLLNPNSQCAEILPNTSIETQSTTFLQVATFDDNITDKDNYFMVVNRRCTPGDDDCSGRRFVSMSLKADRSEFAGFNNWKIIDLFNDSTVYTFDKRIANTISLGKYKPGEGKLYKIAPVMQEGGTFVCDEVVTATTFNCNGTVNTGGYNLNIPATNGLTTISFAQNGTILGYGGTDFIIRGYNQIVLQGQNGNKWRGLTINNCANINIHNTKFKDIGDVVPSSYWALSIYDCPSVEISSCNFELPPQAKGININNFSAEETAGAIMNNNISVSNSTAAIFVGCSSYGYRHLFLMDNVITNSGA